MTRRRECDRHEAGWILECMPAGHTECQQDDREAVEVLVWAMGWCEERAAARWERMQLQEA